jgi:hypothetical protein
MNAEKIYNGNSLTTTTIHSTIHIFFREYEIHENTKQP